MSSRTGSAGIIFYSVVQTIFFLLASYIIPNTCCTTLLLHIVNNPSCIELRIAWCSSVIAGATSHPICAVLSGFCRVWPIDSLELYARAQGCKSCRVRCYVLTLRCGVFYRCGSQRCHLRRVLSNTIELFQECGHWDINTRGPGTVLGCAGCLESR